MDTGPKSGVEDAQSSLNRPSQSRCGVNWVHTGSTIGCLQWSLVWDICSLESQVSPIGLLGRVWRNSCERKVLGNYQRPEYNVTY